MVDNAEYVAVPDELLGLRASIDNIDAAMIYMLAERFRCTQRVGILKAEHHLPPADPAREAEQVARLRALAVTAQLDPEFAEEYLTFVVREVINHHERVSRDALEPSQTRTQSISSQS